MTRDERRGALQVVVEGRRIHLIVDDARSVLGFSATRWVEADSSADAARHGMDLIRRELYARRSFLNADDEPPELVLEEVAEAREAPSVQPGFVWYFEESAAH